jgi:putative ABC transport system permease protein
MLSLQFILANLRRTPVRAGLTMLTVVVAFILFGLLLSLERVFNVGIKIEGADRLVVANKSSIMQPLPLSYRDRIATIDNVSDIAPFAYLGTFFQDGSQQVVTIASEPEAYLKMLPDLVFREPSQRDAWIADRASIMVGRQLADQFGWKVGDLVPLYSAMYPQRGNSSVWTFRVAAIFDAKTKKGNTKSAAIHMDYFDDQRLFGQGTVGWFVVRVKDANASQATARQIEALFANSAVEVEAGAEDAFAHEFMKQIGNFGVMISLALGAVFCTLAVVVANTMAQAVTERTGELSVLKVLGFSDRYVFSHVYFEGAILIFVGGYVGMALAAASVPFVAKQVHLAENMVFLWKDLLPGALAMLVVTTISTLMPAIRAMRLSIGSGLAKVI